MSHSKFKFKSVGNKFSDRKYDNSNITKIRNIGIKTPLRSSSTTEIFDMHTDIRGQIKDNLRNLILTNQGERLCRHNFGANLKSILYDYSKDEQYKQAISKMITDTVEKHMPVINILDIESVVLTDEEKNRSNKLGLAKLKVRVYFSVPKIRVDNLAIEVEMFIGG